MTARVSLPFHVFPQDCWLVPGGWCLFFMLWALLLKSGNYPAVW